MFAGNVSILIALAAGVVSFVSPCILPVIPSYLSFLGGVSFGDLSSRRVSRGGVILKTLFFVAGFSIIFISLGLVFSSAGLLLKGVQTTVYRVAGTIIVLFGLNVLFDFWKAMDIERRFHVTRRPKGAVGSLFLGLAFGAGWTPCVGPILSSILFIAGTSETLTRGAGLLAAYSLGLGAPFVLAGVFFSTFMKYSERLRPHLNAIRIASGVFLILLGILIFLGSLSQLNVALFKLAAGLEEWQRESPLGPRLLFGFFFLGLTSLVAVSFGLRFGRSLRNGGSPVGAILRPLPLMLVLVFLAVSILSFLGKADIGSLISSWLRFQGI